MADLQQLSNTELAAEMNRLTHRMGELSMWMEESDRKICTLILEPYSVPTETKEGKTRFPLYSSVARELDLKQSAELEKYIILAELKKIELEIDKRVEGR
jgi:hypothetical protein